MKIFVDSANLQDIEEALKRGFASGITTNPSILSKEERREFSAHIRDIIALLNRYQSGIPLSVELFTTDPDAMCAQAERFSWRSVSKPSKLPQLARRIASGAGSG